MIDAEPPVPTIAACPEGAVRPVPGGPCVCPAARPNFNTITLGCSDRCRENATWSEADNACLCNAGTHHWNAAALECEANAPPPPTPTPPTPPTPVPAMTAAVARPPAPVIETPLTTTPARPHERFALDVGLGVGGALALRIAYSEAQTINYGGGASMVDCGAAYCDTSPDPTLLPMSHLTVSMRVQTSRSVGLGITVRWQWNAARWEYPARSTLNGEFPVKSNPLADVLLALRIYGVAFRSASNGFRLLGFAGVGLGQISPQIESPTSAEGAHVTSGPFNTHLGFRVEGRLAGPLYLGGELVGHVMAPEILFGFDATAFTGLAF